VLEPILRDIAIDEGIRNDGREAQEKDEPQKECGSRTNQEESQVSANQFTHLGNISRLGGRPTNYFLAVALTCCTIDPSPRGG